MIIGIIGGMEFELRRGRRTRRREEAGREFLRGGGGGRWRLPI